MAEAKKRLPIVDRVPTAIPMRLICHPGNDDAIRAVRLISAAMADAVMEGKQMNIDAAAEAEAGEEAEAAAEQPGA